MSACLIKVAIITKIIIILLCIWIQSQVGLLVILSNSVKYSNSRLHGKLENFVIVFFWFKYLILFAVVNVNFLIIYVWSIFIYLFTFYLAKTWGNLDEIGNNVFLSLCYPDLKSHKIYHWVSKWPMPWSWVREVTLFNRKVVMCYSVMKKEKKKKIKNLNILFHIGNFDYEILHRYNSHFS